MKLKEAYKLAEADDSVRLISSPIPLNQPHGQVSRPMQSAIQAMVARKESSPAGSSSQSQVWGLENILRLPDNELETNINNFTPIDVDDTLSRHGAEWVREKDAWIYFQPGNLADGRRAVAQYVGTDSKGSGPPATGAAVIYATKKDYVGPTITTVPGKR